MTNLKDALVEHSKKQRERDFSETTVISEANRLISEKGAEDYEILKQMGMHKNILKADELKGKKMELQALEEKYGGIFTIDEIKNLACRFRLRFLRSDNYTGHVDPEMFQKIKEFSKDYNIELRGTDFNYKFYILAPKEAFRLEKYPKDPILFYKVDNEHYRMVHKWGADLTTWREAIGWKYQSVHTFMASWAMIFYLMFLVAASLTLSPIMALFLPLLPAGIVLFAIVAPNLDEVQRNEDCWNHNLIH